MRANSCLTPLIVCVRARVCFVHLLDPGVTRPDSTSLSCLSVRFECGTDTVRVRQARETSAALGEKKKKRPKNKTKKTPPQNAESHTDGVFTGLVLVRGGGKEAQQQT